MSVKEDNALIWANQGYDGGLVTNVPAHALDGDQSPDAENFDPTQRYMLKKRLGTSNFSGTNGAPTGTLIRGLAGITYENGTTEIIAKEGTAIYNITAGNWSTTITGHPALVDGDDVHFTMYKNVLIMTSERATPMAPQKKSAAGTFSNLGGSPPSAKYCIVHKGRLFLMCTAADPSRVYFSAINNHEDWSSADNAGNFYIAPGDGMVINGCSSDGENLYISKIAPGASNGAIFMVYGDGPSSFNWRRISWFGAVNSRAWAVNQSYVAVATQQGIFALSANRLQHLSQAVNADWLALTDAQRQACTMASYKSQIWVAYPASGATNTKALVFDTFWQRWSRYNPVTARILMTHPDGSMYGASASATMKVLKYNTGSQDESVDITMYWYTPDLDFGAWYQDKKWTNLYLHCKSQSVTYTIDSLIDGSDTGDAPTIAAATDAPVKRIVGKGGLARGRFLRIGFSETSAVTSEVYGLEVEAQAFPRGQ